MTNIKKKILLVDDEPDILEFISYYLIQNGYEVLTAQNGNKALEILNYFHADLVLLDIMMPGLNGLDVCSMIRNSKGNQTILIAFLTAQLDDEVQIDGFSRGADDYISKPIKMQVLMSRIEALLRRSKNVTRSTEGIININGLLLDANTFEVRKDGKLLELPKKEFLLLYLLASRPGKVYSRDEILSKIWGEEVLVGDRTVDVHIRKIREKLDGEYIKTLKGVGYKFIF